MNLSQGHHFHHSEIISLEYFNIYHLGGSIHLWGGSTLDQAGRVDSGADRPQFVGLFGHWVSARTESGTIDAENLPREVSVTPCS